MDHPVLYKLDRRATRRRTNLDHFYIIRLSQARDDRGCYRWNKFLLDRSSTTPQQAVGELNRFSGKVYHFGRGWRYDGAGQHRERVDDETMDDSPIRQDNDSLEQLFDNGGENRI